MAGSVDLGDVRALLVTHLDNAGIARAKVLPAAVLGSAATHGVTISNSVGMLFSVDDYLNETPELDAVVGDLRGIPDLSALAVLDPAAGLAWAPADLRSLDGGVHPACTRSALRRVVADAAAAGFEFRVGFELECTLFRGTTADPVVAGVGPGYSARALLELEAWMLDTLDALETAGVPVTQLHPEFGNGQVEVALAPRDPMRAVDDLALARLVVTRTTLAHGLLVSFAPVPVLGGATNGCHVHLSATRHGRALFAPPAVVAATPHGFTEDGARMIAGILDRLDEGIALLGGSVLSYRRLQPHSWAGADVCWGPANREAAVRFVGGQSGEAVEQSNIEVKPVDGAANPYLAVAAILASAVDGVARSAELPPPVHVDPSRLSDEERAAAGIRRLPSELGTALGRLERSEFFREVFGGVLLDAYLATRRHEWEAYGTKVPDTVASAVRWRY